MGSSLLPFSQDKGKGIPLFRMKTEISAPASGRTGWGGRLALQVSTLDASCFKMTSSQDGAWSSHWSSHEDPRGFALMLEGS